MVIITKKRVVYKIVILLLVMLAFFLLGYGKKNKKITKTIETVSLPVNNRVIVLDAGHGSPDLRCTKCKSEQQRNKQI